MIAFLRRIFRREKPREPDTRVLPFFKRVDDDAKVNEWGIAADPRPRVTEYGDVDPTRTRKRTR